MNKSEMFRSRNPFPIRADKSGVSDDTKKSYDPEDAPDGNTGDLPGAEHPEKGENFKI